MLVKADALQSSLRSVHQPHCQLVSCRAESALLRASCQQRTPSARHGLSGPTQNLAATLPAQPAGRRELSSDMTQDARHNKAKSTSSLAYSKMSGNRLLEIDQQERRRAMCSCTQLCAVSHTLISVVARRMPMQTLAPSPHGVYPRGSLIGLPLLSNHLQGSHLESGLT